MADKDCLEGGVDMAVFAVAKKDPYIISSEEAKIVFSATRNVDAQKRAMASAERL